MDLNQLRSFLAVTQTLNFTAAARQNGVPQSTISRQIGDLEEQLGARLFFRTKRNVELTAEGRTFLPYAQEIMDAAQKGVAAVRQLHNGSRGRLALATIPAGAGFLTRCLREFGRRYPEIVVDIRYVSSGDALQDEGQDPYDFHFIHSDMLLESEEYDALITHEDELRLIVPAGHRFTREPWQLADLSGERFLLVSEPESPILYMLIRNYFRACRLSPVIANESDNVRAVLLGVGAGLGVTILPGEQTRETAPDGLAALPLPGMEEPVRYAMAWRKSLLNPAARLFLEVVREITEN